MSVDGVIVRLAKRTSSVALDCQRLPLTRVWGQGYTVGLTPSKARREERRVGQFDIGSECGARRGPGSEEGMGTGARYLVVMLAE